MRDPSLERRVELLKSAQEQPQITRAVQPMMERRVINAVRQANLRRTGLG
jgi:hypothetical protein